MEIMINFNVTNDTVEIIIVLLLIAYKWQNL